MRYKNQIETSNQAIQPGMTKQQEQAALSPGTAVPAMITEYGCAS
jgi:hypothetical protein